MRTANARHYISGNGERKAVITGSSRHYYSEADKRMRRIDNTLELKNGAYENKYNGFKVRFAADATSDSLMRVQKSGYEVSFALAENNGGKARMLRRKSKAVLRDMRVRMSEDNDVLESGIDYPEIFDGVNFEYEVKPNEIKENIRIAKRMDSYEFAFIVSANGLRLEANGNNDIEFYPESGGEINEPVFTMPAPYMFDDGGETSHDVRYETERIGDGTYLLKILPDEMWINAADRKFPVTIDPTVVMEKNSVTYAIVNNTKYVGEDFYRIQKNPLYGDANFRRVGYFFGRAANEETARKSFGESKLYIKIDSSEIKNKHIRSATLQIPLMVESDYAGTKGFFELRGITSSWNASSLAWNNLPQESSEVLAAAKNIQKKDTKQYYLAFDITAALNKRYNGFVIYGSEVGMSVTGAMQQNYAYFPESMEASKPARVTLSITYIDENKVHGDKSVSQSCGMAGSGAVDLFTGGLTFNHEILNLDGAQFPLNISLLYNSDRHNNMNVSGYNFGLGWGLNFMHTVKEADTLGGTTYSVFDEAVVPVNYYEYTDAMGYTQEIYTRYGQYKTEPQSGEYNLNSEVSNDNYVLNKVGDEITLTDKAGNILRFEKRSDIDEYRLKSIEKPETKNNSALKMTVVYGTNYITVSDANGRTVRFNFSDSDVLHPLENIMYDGKIIRSFKYAAGTVGLMLEKVTTAEGTVTFGYAETYEYLNKVTDSSGYTVEYKSEYANKKPKITGYYIKSAVSEISYNADEKAGLVAGSEKTLDDITITYNTSASSNALSLSAMPNLTEVSNLVGAKTYYCFNSQGMAQAVFDGKGNLEAYRVGIETDEIDVAENSSVNSITVRQTTAKVIAGAMPVYGNPVHSHMAFNAEYINAEDSRNYYSYISRERLTTGAYVFMAQISGTVASCGQMNSLDDGDEKNMPYIALRIVKTLKTPKDGKTAEEEFVAFESIADDNKVQAAFLPFTVNGDEVESVSASIETRNNPNSIWVNNWYMLRASEGFKVTVKDKDVAISESYANGVCAVTETDISKRTNNTRKTSTKRGKASAKESTTQYESSQYPERVVREEDNYLKRSYTYDACGNITGEEIQDKTSSKIMCREYSYVHNAAELSNNAITSVTDEDGNTFKYDYEAATGFMKRATLPGTGLNIDYTYNGVEGLLKSVKAQAAKYTESCENKFSYNVGYLTKLDCHGCEYRFKYDGFGRITEITVGGDSYIRAKYTDNGNNIDGVTNAVSKTVVAYVDNVEIPTPYCGRTSCGADKAKSSGNHVYASYYDKYGELVRVRYAFGVSLDYGFDSVCDYVTVDKKEGKIPLEKVIKYTVGDTVYEYTLNKVTDEMISSTEYRRGHEKFKAESIEKDSYGRVTKTQYSVNGEPQTYSYAYKSVYDDGIREVTLPNGKKDAVTTDNFGRIAKRTLNTTNVIEDVITYKNARNHTGAYYTTPLVSKMECKVATAAYAIYTYEYDANGNIMNIYDSGTLKAAYDYDGLNRLVREEIPNKSVTVFLYDKDGNITSRKIFDYEPNYRKPTAELFESAGGQTVNYSYMQSGNKDRLLTYNGSGELTYDGYGNPKQWFKHNDESSETKYALDWSKVNRLTEITDRDTNERYEYTYDYNGIRTRKKVGKTEYEYYLDGSNIIAETRTTGETVEKLIYYYGTTGIVGFNYNGTDYYYQKNIQGDIVRIYNERGMVYGQYDYDAWGKCTVVLNTNGIATLNPFRYRGYYLDNETGLCYLNSRYYDPAVGRFLSPDSLDYLDPETIGGLNLYAYCGNNPVMYADPSGHFIISLIVTLMIIGGIAGALIGGVVAGITAYNNGYRGWDLFGRIMLGALFGGAIGVAAGFAMGVMGPAIGGLGAKALGDVMVASGAAALMGAMTQIGIAAGAIYVTAAGATAIGNVMFAKNIVDENGVSISHNYPNDHGNPVHVHVNGGGPNTKVGPNGYPTQGRKPMSSKQREVFDKHIKEIRKVIRKWQKWIRKR